MVMLQGAEKVGGESSFTATAAATPPQTPPLGDISYKAPQPEMPELGLFGWYTGLSGGSGAMKEDTVAAMVRQYLLESIKSQQMCPLPYWVKKEAVWPDLSALAQGLRQTFRMSTSFLMWVTLSAHIVLA